MLYCFLKGYARRYGYELQTSNWIGKVILANTNEPPISQHFPQTELDSHTRRPMDRYFGAHSIDIRVYAQHQIYIDGFYTQADVRNWLKLKPEFETYALKERPITVAHIRRGDIVDNESFSKYYCAVSEESYDQAVEHFNIPKPVLKVFEGWKTPPPELPASLNWIEDFLLMRDAQYLLRGNSTFSLVAGWLGSGTVYSPRVDDKVGWQTVPFELGNHCNTAGKFHNQSELFLKEE